jgi:pimeloyl-ACP methyl ester carboxylesterase
MPHALVGGCRIWYQLTGSGPYLVQIGGAISAHEGYTGITEVMAERFTVLDYDHRGYGLSDRPEQRYSMDVWSDDLAGLLDAIGIERLHVHGASMGGFVAARFAADHPERVDRLVISGAIARCDRMAKAHFEVWKHLARAHGIDSRELAVHLTTHAFSRPHLDAVDFEELVEGIRAVTERNVTVEVFCAACDAMSEADVTDLLPRIAAPTLVLVGSEDVLTPLDTGPSGTGMRAMAELIPNARLHVIDGCGHGNMFEAPDASNAAILDFLLGEL